MNLSQELINVLEKAMKENTYFNPYLISDIINAIQEACPNYDDLISEELYSWAENMWSR